MRVLFCHRPGGAFGYITDSMINAFRDKGHDVRRWDGHIASWRQFEPDLYCGASGHRQPIPEKRGKCKVALHVNPFGPVDISGINESQDTINWTMKQRPNAVFGYGFESDRILWSYWQQKNHVPWVPVPTAGDKTFFKYKPEQERTTDIVYLGGRWQYKGYTIDAYLLPVLKDGRMSYRLYGWGDWPNGISSGILAEDAVVDFLNSGKVAPCIAEKHTHSHGIDIPERVWKVALCGAVAVHDAVPTLKQHFHTALVANSPEEMLKLCYHYSRPEHAAERQEIADAQRNEVLANHTYHHRMAALLRQLGFNAEADHMLS